MIFKKNEENFELNSPQPGRLPIYILGKTPLGIYLASRFSSAGENVVIISSDPSAPDRKLEFSIREEHSLKKNCVMLNTSAHSEQVAKMLIITSENYHLKSELFLLSPKHFYSCPVVVFATIPDLKIIEALLGHSTIRGNFDGFLNTKENQISLLGSEPLITLSKPFNTLEFSLKALSIFHSANLLTQTCEDKNQIFWESFTSHAATSLLSAFYKQNIFNIIKNTERREEATDAIRQLSLLASSENIKLDADEIIKRLYNTPINYISETQFSNRKAELELSYIHKTISDTAHKNKVAIPTLQKLLKNSFSS